VGAAIGLSVLPDLDIIWIRARRRRGGGRLNHHEYFSHTPAFFLVLALTLAHWLSWQVVLLFAVVTLGHLMLDSWATDDGIMWLYPFCRKQYALLPRPIHGDELYGRAFYKYYYGLRHFLVAELVLTLGGLVVVGITFMPALLRM